MLFYIVLAVASAAAFCILALLGAINRSDKED